MTFEELLLHPALLRALRAEGYETPTPIQCAAIGPARDGRDLLGCAQTGTGKTAAFALPILHRLANNPPPHALPPSSSAASPTASRATAHGHGQGAHHGHRSISSHRDAPRGPVRPLRVLVLTPTRELASQVAERFEAYGRELAFRTAVIFGGVGQAQQERALRAGVDILVACPGRLLDLMGQGLVALNKLEILVLDEADRMLDMGFVHDVRRVLAAVPRERQTLFFSATMPDEIRALASEILRDPVYVEVTPAATTAEKVDQSVYFVEKVEKRALLLHLLSDHHVTRALVFARTKHGAGRVAEWLTRQGVPSEAIHGNKSQNARERALAAFKKGTVRVLCATDIAARGIDVDGVSHVVNLDLPNEPESYVHRIGRTARAGATGVAWSLCDVDERAYLRQIERVIRQRVPVVTEHPFRSPHPPPADEPARGSRGASHPARAPQGGRSHGAPASHRGHGGAPAAGRSHEGARTHAPRDAGARPVHHSTSAPTHGPREHAPRPQTSAHPPHPSREGGAPRAKPPTPGPAVHAREPREHRPLVRSPR